MPLVAQISDVHLRREPSDPAQPGNPDWCLERTVETISGALDGRALDLVVLTGDIADDGSVEGCARTLGLLAPLGVPVVATPGNHDRSGAVSEVFGAATSIELGGWWIELVDTVIPGQDAGRIDPADVAARLDAARDRPTVLALHHPLITLSTNDMFQLDGAAAVIDLLRDRPWVRAVVSGHLHEAFNLHLAGVAHLGAPSTWYSLHHEADEYRFVDELVGAQLLDLRDDGTVAWERVPR